MELYLMQHGNPVSKEDNPERPLSAQGIRDITNVAAFLERCGIKVDRVLHSGKTRARQTAEIICSRLTPGKGPVQHEKISPLDDVRDFSEQIKGYEEDLMIVGHLPHLAKLASFLIAGSEAINIVSFKQGGVLCLIKEYEQPWTISWMVIPEIIQ
jgi:phosphohistidine phosphatase